jgi:uncharacterized protein
MLWDDEAEALVERVNTRIPTFVRGMVRRVIAKESERLALEGGAARVTAAHVRSAYLTRTPAPMQPFLAAALGDGAGGPDAAAEAPEFPVGEPMTPADIEEFLAWEGTGRLGTSGRDGQPYVVPLSFVHDEGAIYYHWFAEDGRKVRAIRENARVCFEADWATRDQLSYRSVIADGVIEEITDLARKAHVLGLLERKFPAYATGAGHSAEVREIIHRGAEQMAEAVRIFRIRITRISGKKKGTWKAA